MTIRTRLTIWYTGLMSIALLLFAVVFYSVLYSASLAAVDNRLAAQARRIADAIEADGDPRPTLLTGRVRLPAMEVFSSPYYFQITDLAGKVLQLSENLQGRRLPLSSTHTEDARAGRTNSYTAATGPEPGAAALRIYSRPVTLSGSPTATILVGHSLAELEESLSAFRRAMVLAIVALLLPAGLGGITLARASLRPIETITQTARRITMAQHLDQRIPVSGPNDELGRLATTINDMLARLEVLFQAEQRLVADVSHELRTPLTTIRGNLELLRRGTIEDPALRADALRSMEDEASRMSRLISDLLLLSQADAGMKLQLQPVEMDTLLLEVYRQIQVMAQGVTVRLGGEDQALVMGDPDRLRQLLLNLADNALKYTPAGGNVTLELEKRDGEVCIRVADTGVGIAAEDLEHIFERFYRAAPGRARPGGSGLGLSIAQWIARAHGGRLEAASTPSEGSVFTLWLPLAQDDAPAAAVPARAARAPAETIRG